MSLLHCYDHFCILFVIPVSQRLPFGIGGFTPVRVNPDYNHKFEFIDWIPTFLPCRQAGVGMTDETRPFGNLRGCQGQDKTI